LSAKGRQYDEVVLRMRDESKRRVEACKLRGGVVNSPPVASGDLKKEVFRFRPPRRRTLLNVALGDRDAAPTVYSHSIVAGGLFEMS
jgi:hypothetical protein